MVGTPQLDVALEKSTPHMRVGAPQLDVVSKNHMHVLLYEKHLNQSVSVTLINLLPVTPFKVS